MTQTETHRPDEYAIWWLDQRSWELAAALLADKIVWPEYIHREFESRSGRGGGGRLWVAEQFADFRGMDWKSGDPVYDMIGGSYGGIVILLSDAHHVAAWPGFVSDLKMRPVAIAAVTPETQAANNEWETD